jgi:hypothetical protein
MKREISMSIMVFIMFLHLFLPINIANAIEPPEIHATSLQYNSDGIKGTTSPTFKITFTNTDGAGSFTYKFKLHGNDYLLNDYQTWISFGSSIGSFATKTLTVSIPTFFGGSSTYAIGFTDYYALNKGSYTIVGSAGVKTY